MSERAGGQSPRRIPWLPFPAPWSTGRGPRRNCRRWRGLPLREPVERRRRRHPTQCVVDRPQQVAEQPEVPEPALVGPAVHLDLVQIPPGPKAILDLGAVLPVGVTVGVAPADAVNPVAMPTGEGPAAAGLVRRREPAAVGETDGRVGVTAG